MKKQQVFLFLAHSYSKEIVREFKKIQRATKGIGECFVLYQQKADTPIHREILNLPHYVITDTDLLNSSDAPYFANSLFSYKADRALIKFYREHKFSYYWLIEYDVRFSGNWKNFFRYFSNSKEDFLSSHIRRYEQEPDWEHWAADHFDKKIELTKAFRSFNPIFRISRPALDYVYKMYLSGWTGHYEALIATLLFHGNFSIRDFGGAGEFVFPEDINQFYLDSTDSELLDGKTMRYRPSHLFLFGYPKNKLIHPVKPSSFWKKFISKFLRGSKKIWSLLKPRCFYLKIAWDNLYRFVRIARLNGFHDAWSRAKRRLKKGSIGKNILEETQKLSIDATLIDSIQPFSFPIPPETPDVSIIIPAHNQWLYTYNCLNVISKACAKHSYEVILADDNSSDETVNAGKIIENLIVVRSEKNQGFLLNCKHAASRARGRYLYFLNNDTKCLAYAIDSLAEVLDHDPKAGIVGSKLLYPDGRLQEAGGIVWANGSAWNYGRFEDPLQPEFCYRRETDYVSGASLMVRRDLWDRLGGFDERFSPAYCEDSDLCFSARAAGFRVIFQPESKVIHYEGISNGTDVKEGIKKYQVKNTKTFFSKWQDILVRDHFPDQGSLFVARDRTAGRPTVLVIDHYVPHYDRDAGSRTIWAFIRALIEAGNNVKFLGDNFYLHQPYTDELQQMGVEVLYGNWYAGHWEGWLKENGRFFDAVLFSRPFIVKKYLKAVRQFTKARLLYYCHDLHFLREERRLQISGEKAGSRSVEAIRHEELDLMREMDMVLHCSHEEITIIKQALPGKDVRYVPPYVIDVLQTSNYDPLKRNGILFVGGFNHPPNVDAVLWFSREIFPAIRALCPEIVFFVAGSNPPKAVKDLAGSGIQIHADVDDKFLQDLYNSVRIALVPLRYGAGVKGKTVEAMGFGLPVASTSCGLEGLPEEMKKAAFLCSDGKEAMISMIVSVYNDPVRLSQASVAGREASWRWFSRAGMRQTWAAVINEQLSARSIQLT